MTRFVARWLATFVAVLVVSHLLRFLVFPTLGSAALFALALGLLNAFIRPVLVLLTLPLTIVTLGLFALVLNLFLFWLAAGLAGVHVGGGLLGLVVAAIAVSVVSGLIGRLAGVK